MRSTQPAAPAAALWAGGAVRARGDLRRRWTAASCASCLSTRWLDVRQVRPNQCMFIGLLVNHACAWVLLGGDPKLRIHAARTAFLPNVLQSRRTDSACQCLTS